MKEGSWEWLEEENRERSDEILFQLKIFLLRKKNVSLCPLLQVYVGSAWGPTSLDLSGPAPHLEWTHPSRKDHPEFGHISVLEPSALCNVLNVSVGSARSPNCLDLPA